MGKKMLLIAAVVLSVAGAISSAQAAGGQGEDRGGIKIGPMGQVFGTARRSRAAAVWASVAPSGAAASAQARAHALSCDGHHVCPIHVGSHGWP